MVRGASDRRDGEYGAVRTVRKCSGNEPLARDAALRLLDVRGPESGRRRRQDGDVVEGRRGRRRRRASRLRRRRSRDAECTASCAECDRHGRACVEKPERRRPRAAHAVDSRDNVRDANRRDGARGAPGGHGEEGEAATCRRLEHSYKLGDAGRTRASPTLCPPSPPSPRLTLAPHPRVRYVLAPNRSARPYADCLRAARVLRRRTQGNREPRPRCSVSAWGCAKVRHFDLVYVPALITHVSMRFCTPPKRMPSPV